MAMLYHRARRIAWNFHDPDKNGSGSAVSNGTSFGEKTREIQRLHRSAGFEKFADALKKDGCVVVKDFTNLKTLERANREVDPWLQQQKQDDMKEDGWMRRTRTITKLMQRSPTLREEFYADSLYQLLCEFFLTTESHTWNGGQSLKSVSHPLLSSAITFDMPFVGASQAIHRDDQYYHARHNSVSEYHSGRDILLGLFVPGSNTFKEGTIKVVPGSHLWGDEKPESASSGSKKTLGISLRKGEALIMLGSLYYGIGDDDDDDEQGAIDISQSQLLHAMFSCSGVHRQEENPFLTYSSKEVKQFSQLVQERLGWRHREASLGWIDLKSPEYLLA